MKDQNQCRRIVSRNFVVKINCFQVQQIWVRSSFENLGISEEMFDCIFITRIN